jgi:mannosyltransferase OCH1-like enzyme
MKLKEYSQMVKKLAKKHPDFEMVYATDDEGNGFSPLNFEPSILSYDFENGEINDDGEDNAVCVN